MQPACGASLSLLLDMVERCQNCLFKPAVLTWSHVCVETCTCSPTLGENEKKKGEKLEFEVPGMQSCIAPDTYEEDCCQDEVGYCQAESG